MKKLLGPLLFSLSSAMLMAQNPILQSDGGTGFVNSNIYQDARGNVGIGTTAPSANLEVSVTNLTSGPQYIVNANYPDVGSPPGPHYFVGQRLGVVQYPFGTSPTIIDFMVNNKGQVGIGFANDGTATDIDLAIQNHGWAANYGDDKFVMGALDDNNVPLFLFSNAGSSTQASGHLTLIGNSAVNCPDIPFAILDGNPNVNSPVPIFAVSAQGFVSIGASNTLAELEVMKNASFAENSTCTVPLLMHVGDGSGYYHDFFTIAPDGKVGVGEVNYDDATLSVRPKYLNYDHVPGLLVKGISYDAPIDFIVREQGAGIGVDPTVNSSTLALKGTESAGTRVDLYEPVAGWGAAAIRFYDNNGQRHMIGEGNDGELLIKPGWFGNGTSTVKVEGSLKVVNQLIIGSHSISCTGCTHNDAVLYADGKIAAKAAVVTLEHWSDYVFDKDYKLQTLESLEQYVSENKHLPGVPSADEVKKDGNNLGEMDATLLAKIEELSLYVIKVNNDNLALKTKIEKLENDLKK